MNYEVAPFSLNNPSTLTRSRCMLQCFALHAVKNYGKFSLSSQISISIGQILKFHERVISALKFELSGERSQILVANSCE